MIIIYLSIYLTFFNLPHPATAATTTLLLRNASDLRNCTSLGLACGFGTVGLQ